MKSYTLRQATQFNLTDNHPIVVDGNNYGSISKIPNSSRIINRKTMQPFQCTYLETLTEDIIVDGNLYPEYQKSKSFFLYYCESENLLFVETSTSIAKNFLKRLGESHPTRVQLQLFKFDFNTIRINSPSVKGLYFNVEDDIDVDSKAFFGNDVDNNNEANTAISEENATYLMISKDIASVNRTIGFSQKSAIVIYNKVNPDNEYLQLITDIYDNSKSSISVR